MRGQKTDDAKRAEALALLAAGKGVREVSRETGLSSSLITRLKAGMGEELEQVGALKQQSFADTFARHFSIQLEALNRIATAVSSPEYINKQNATGMRDIYEVIAGRSDKLLDMGRTMRIAETRQITEPPAAEPTVS